MAYAIVRTDLMQGSIDPSALVSVKLSEELQNGSVVLPTSPLPGNPSCFDVGAVKADTPLSQVVLIATPELMYEAENKDLALFVNKPEVPARGYRFISGNIFSVTAEALDGAAGVNKTVELQNGSKLKVVVTPTAGSTKVGTIIAIDNVGGRDLYVIRVA